MTDAPSSAPSTTRRRYESIQQSASAGSDGRDGMMDKDNILARIDALDAKIKRIEELLLPPAPAPTPTLVEGVEELTKQFGSMNRDEFNAMVIEPTYGWNPFVKAMATVMNALTKEKRLAQKRDAVIEAAKSCIKAKYADILGNRYRDNLDFAFTVMIKALRALKDEEEK